MSAFYGRLALDKFGRLGRVRKLRADGTWIGEYVFDQPQFGNWNANNPHFLKEEDGDRLEELLSGTGEDE